LNAHLINFNYDYRAALSYLNRFREAFIEQGYQVTTLTKPLDISPTGSIDDSKNTPSETLDFSLKLSRRPPV